MKLLIPYEEFDVSMLDDIKELDNRRNKWSSHTKSVASYINIECAFDIETTSIVTENEQKAAFMYIWMFGIHDGEHIIYGRTWEEFLSFCHELQEYLLLDTENILPVYVHNLGFEFQFFRKYFTWIEKGVFSADERKPIHAICDMGIEFRDSYILSGYSLETVAKNLTSHNIKKLTGDLDYSLIRHDETPLTDEEFAYCNNDVEILLCYINEQMALYDDNITKIPMTNTGRVRKYVREKCYYKVKGNKKTHKKASQNHRLRYRELMEELVLSVEEYQKCKDGFMGGFTHASMLHVGEVLNDVYSIDFTSSYPYVMLAEKFPYSKPIPVEIKSKKELEEIVNNPQYGLLFTVTLCNVHSKLTYETYLSENKCQCKNAVVNNGRIFQADMLRTTITDIDFQIIYKCYDFDMDNIGVQDAYRFNMQYLPKPIIESILDFYEQKTVLKGVEGKEAEYLNGKGMLNSVYGMSVTSIIRDLIEYDEEWSIQKADAEMMKEQIEKYNEGKNRFLYYPWGVYVTAYARRNLWNGILEMKDDYVYSDTDSIKFLNYATHEQYIKNYNTDVEKKLKAMCNYNKIDFGRMSPKTIKGETKLIGVWDYEGKYDKFKTLGAKRYLTWSEKDGFHLTVAGLSKQNGMKYMVDVCRGNVDMVFNMFSDELYIPKEKTGKNTHTYIDSEITCEVTDYTGITKTITTLSGVHLEPCEFTLSISKVFNKFLRDLKAGYLYVGKGVYDK